MAELTFFATNKDFEKLAQFMFDSFASVFVPSISFNEPKGLSLRNLQDIRAHLADHPKEYALSYFVISNYWEIEPLCWKYLANPKHTRPHHYVMQRYGGPAFHFIPSYSFPRFGKKKLVAGSFYDYPYYISGKFLSKKEED